MFCTMLKVNNHFSDPSPRKPRISKVLSTAKLFLQPARELYVLNNPHSSRKRFLKKFYLLPTEATGKCHLRVTRKSNRTTAVVAIQVLVIHVAALLTPAHSPLCQLQLLHFYPLHQNIKSVDFYFFGLSFTWGRTGRGSSELHSLCLTHTLSPQRVTRACRGGCQQQEQLCQGWGMEQMPYLIPGPAQGAPTNHSPHWLHLQQRAERLAGHTGAGLLSRTIPPVEQLRFSPFHQHQVIQFHFCTSWVYLARRETSSLLSSC